MSDVVDLESYRAKAATQRGFGPWEKRFGETYGENTGIGDLSNKTLYALALPGQESNTAFYELIMGILGLGHAAKFYYLDKKDQLKIIDIHLFLADMVRFEMMHRLGWTENRPGEHMGLLDIVQKFDQIKEIFRKTPPRLSSTHPEFLSYSSLTKGDRESFIRRLLPKALEAFKQIL